MKSQNVDDSTLKTQETEFQISFFFFLFIQSWFLSLWYKLITCIWLAHPMYHSRKKNPTSYMYMYLASAECWHIHKMSSTSTWNSSHNNLCRNVSCTHVHVLEILQFYVFAHPSIIQAQVHSLLCICTFIHTTDKSECIHKH